MKGAVAAMILSALILFAGGTAAAKWGGVDETVVEKYAEEHGRAARDPYINTDKGDLLLFAFLIAGAAGGFMGGYYWRMLTEKNASGGNKK
jgi:hypothetical protein